MTAVTIVWFRLDLRLADHPALHAAAARGVVVPVYIYSPEEESEGAPGAASRWWLDRSLRALEQALRQRGLPLTVRRGPAAASLAEVAAAAGATAVYWNRGYEPAGIARDTGVKEQLRARGLEALSFKAALLLEPWEVRNLAGKPFQVFTPFWKHCRAALGNPEPLPTPPVLLPGPTPPGLSVDALDLLPRIPWYAGMAASWQPGEAGAHGKLERFLGAAFFDYGSLRNRPDLTGTSRLSPHLHFGEISPRQVWAATGAAAGARGLAEETWRASTFLTELGWREFAHHLLFHFPHTTRAPLRPQFARLWSGTDGRLLEAWTRGRTGIPMVDAGMRELWGSGWMHNRVRMIVASFLTKNLLQPWQDGADWFLDTLVDADLASNTLGWQWTAGCGADAAPYFRIFNPVTQGMKFDPEGHYVRRWIPELAALEGSAVHAPWESGMRPAGYPPPVVDLAASRAQALEAYARLTGR